MVTEILLGITALSLLKRKPKIGLLPGTRIRKGDLKRLIKSGAKGSVNNDDVLFSDGFLVQMTPNKNGDYPTATPKERDYYKEIINKTYEINDKHLRTSEGADILDYEYVVLSMPNEEERKKNKVLYDIASGVKFRWDDKKVNGVIVGKGLENSLFGKKSPYEKKAFRTIIDNKKGLTIEELAERYSLTEDLRGVIIETLLECNNRQDAENELFKKYTTYLQQYAFNKDVNNNVPF